MTPDLREPEDSREIVERWGETDFHSNVSSHLLETILPTDIWSTQQETDLSTNRPCQKNCRPNSCRQCDMVTSVSIKNCVDQLVFDENTWNIILYVSDITD